MLAFSMLCPVRTITVGFPSSTPVVNTLPLIRYSRRSTVFATSKSASLPNAETMPNRGVQSVRQPAASRSLMPA